jgi:hypothetical protein
MSHLERFRFLLSKLLIAKERITTYLPSQIRKAVSLETSLHVNHRANLKITSSKNENREIGLKMVRPIVL